MNKLKSLLINTKLYQYLSYLKNHKRKLKRNEYFKAEGAHLLQLFASTLNQHNIPFWLDYGTLLGFYRDHDFISHDFDLDFGTKMEYSEDIRRILISAGFKLIKEYHVDDSMGLEECYKFGHTTLDVFYYQPTSNDNEISCYSFRHFNRVKNRDVGKKVPVGVQEVINPFIGLSKVRFKDSDIFVPQNTEEYLIANYGKDYMIPNPKFNWMKDATNIKIFTYEEKPGWALFYEVI